MPRYKIPDIVQSYCEGYVVKYRGTFKGKKVYTVTLSDGGFECTGFPCYVLWDPNAPKGIEQVSDIDLQITVALNAQKEEARKKRAAKKQNQQDQQHQH